MLELVDVRARLEKHELLQREMDVEIERRIGQRVRHQMEKIQKEYYLREQIKAIQRLGDKDDKTEEIEEYRERLRKGSYPEEVRKAVEKEIHRLESLSNMSTETGVIRSYVDCLLELPWETVSEDAVDIHAAEKILNADHYGLEKVKERILETFYFGIQLQSFPLWLILK